jgi:hypothetical protein
VMHEFNVFNWGEPMGWGKIPTHIGPLQMEPDKYSLQFKDGYIKRIKSILAEKGISLVETEKKPATDCVFVEMEVSVKEGIPLLRRTLMATRWYISYPARSSPLEIYEWDSGGRFLDGGMNPPEQDAIFLAEKTTKTFLLGMI